MGDFAKKAVGKNVDFIFFDSGTGGIPYMLYLKEKSPNSHCIYVADTRNFPYGEKTTEQITEASCSALHLILQRFVPKAFVIGCNTISVSSLEQLRRRFSPIPFVGTVPAIKQAALVTKNGRIGLLATKRTVDQSYTAELVKQYADGCTLVSRADPGLIDFIEHDFFTASESEKERAVQSALDFFLENNADTVVLGCTHFLHVSDVIVRKAGGRFRVVDSKEGVVNQALRLVRPDSACSAKTKDCTLFISGPVGIDEIPYKILAERWHLSYGGILSSG